MAVNQTKLNSEVIYSLDSKRSVSSLSMKYCVRAQTLRIVEPVYRLCLKEQNWAMIACSCVEHRRSRCSTVKVIGAADEYRSTYVLMRKI